MRNTKLTKVLSLLLSMVLITAMALTLFGCGKNDTPATDSTAPADTVGTENIGEGKHEFHFYVKYDGTVQKHYTVRSDKDTVGDALLENGLIEGDIGEYGLYVTKVDGITADYNTDGTYWAFYVDGEYALSGVDMTEITDGAEYMFSKEK